MTSTREERGRSGVLSQVLGVGVGMALIDALWVRLAAPALAGAAADRLADLAVTVAADTASVALLALLLSPLARFFSRWLRLPPDHARACVLVAGAGTLLGLGIAIERDFHEAWSTLALAAAVVVLPFCLLALAAVSARALGRHSPLPIGRALTVLFALWAVALVAHGPSTVARGEDDRPNLILVSIDTLRADHLSPYGYSRETSPTLRELAEDGVVFETAYAQSNWTLPSHVSMLTGLEPFAHGVIYANHRMREEQTTVAEQLRDAGYFTGGWVALNSFSWLGAKRGFSQGFDLYQHGPHPSGHRRGLLVRTADSVLARTWQRGVGNATYEIDSVIRWLSSARREPFFLFIHLYDVHSKLHRLPYEAPEPFFDQFCEGELEGVEACPGSPECATRYLRLVGSEEVPRPDRELLDKFVCLYDGQIAYVDHELGRLFDALETFGLHERTAIAVTADHGEAFLEHDNVLHTYLYDEVTRVPLLFRVPGGLRGKRATGLARVIDVAPTLLDLAGVEPADAAQGVSLRDAIFEAAARAPAEHAVAFGHKPNLSLVLRNETRKYIQSSPQPGQGLVRAPPEELYDLERDPGERVNRARNTRELKALRDQLANQVGEGEALRKRLRLDGEAGDFEVPDAERERLRALGYVD